MRGVEEATRMQVTSYTSGRNVNLARHHMCINLLIVTFISSSNADQHSVEKLGNSSQLNPSRQYLQFVLGLGKGQVIFATVLRSGLFWRSWLRAHGSGHSSLQRHDRPLVQHVTR